MKPVILLPDTVYFTKPVAYQPVTSLNEEFHLYYENMFLPYDKNWDIVIRCPYGQNMGNCFLLRNYDGKEETFPLTVYVYDNGERIAEKTVTMVAVQRETVAEPFTALFLGDSMTRAQRYIEHVAGKINGLITVGTRCFDGKIRHEGRGGWAWNAYFGTTGDEKGMSPFLFPKGIAGEDYFGAAEFWDAVREPGNNPYYLCGFVPQKLREGMCFLKGGALYRFTEGKEVKLTDRPEMELDFGKYLARYRMDPPGLLSILMGANDLQAQCYDLDDGHGVAARDIPTYVDRTEKFVNAVKKASPETAVLVNLPVCGAEQYAWGLRRSGNTAKGYRRNMLSAAKLLLERFDNRQEEGIYVSAPLLTIDPQNGFDTVTECVNVYSDVKQSHQSNWVHPSPAGYFQMGDAIAPVIAYCMQKSR